jgi:phenylalanyl-tRNA synthetase beta chain
MLLSPKWLQEFTPFEGTLDELAHTLTMIGLEVEEQVEPFAHLAEMVVGSVQTCRQHPDADHLRVCEVNMGGEDVPIVCGAPNVAAGQRVAVAPVGSTLPDGTQVRKAKIRGQPSQGMILSERELQLGEDHTGIMVLGDAAEPGRPLTEALDLDSVLLDVGITPNRADCLSMLGLAREVAAYFRLPLHLPRMELREEHPECESQVRLQIEDPELCPLYQARIVRDISVGPSPAWMRYRLLAMGLRPINAIVDITNYVLLELGQPLHAFDETLISGSTIRVAPAEKEQDLVTLDGEEQHVQPGDLLIRDAEKPVALAGIMGCANSEIGESSTDVLLECAVFHPGTIRKTARRLGLSSGASYRFERGVDQPGSEFALHRAAHLIQRLSGGRVLSGVAKSEPKPWTSPAIDFRPENARKLTFLDAEDDFCNSTLRSLGCEVDRSEGGRWRVRPPSYRLDLQREVDLVEEIARFFGFEQVPAELPRIAKPLREAGEADELEDAAPYSFIRRIKAWAQGVGLTEAINYSFVGSAELRRLGSGGEGTIAIRNPLTSDQDTLRPCLAPGLLQNVRLNVDQNNPDQRVFEVARVFGGDDRSETGARERNRLGILVHGRRHPARWSWPREESDYLDLKGLLEHLLQSLRLSGWAFEPETDHPYLDPCVAVRADERQLGSMGRIRPDIGRDYHARFPIWLAELDLDLVYRMHRCRDMVYRPWPKFPPVLRDITIIAPEGVHYRSIHDTVARAGLANLESFALQDIYQPEGSQERHITLRLTYRHPRKTLTDREVDKQHNDLGEFLLQSLPVRFPG